MIKLIAPIALALIAAPAHAARSLGALPVAPLSLPTVRVPAPAAQFKAIPAVPARLPGIVPVARPDRTLPSPNARLPIVPTAIVAIVNAPTAVNLALAFDNAAKPEPAPVAVPAMPAQTPVDLVKGNARITFPEQDLLDDIGIVQ